MKPAVIVEYFPKGNWLLHAADMAEEIFTTLEEDVKGVTLISGSSGGRYAISIGAQKIFDRKEYGGFPEIKELKQMLRDVVAPGISHCHSDSKSRHYQ